jgi:putative ABC transport system substrate-binding protein
MKWGRTALTVLLALGLLVVPLAAEAQQAGKVYRIGHLPFTTCPVAPYTNDPLRSAFRDLGYVEGQNIVIECRAPGGQPDRLNGLAAELVRLKVDVLVTSSTPSALAARRATSTIPIIFSFVADPVGAGLVASLGRPGGNITGVSIVGRDAVKKGLELLKEGAPLAARVAIVTDPANQGQAAQVPDQMVAANALGLHLQRVEVRAPVDLDSAFAAILRERAQTLYLYPLRIGPAEVDRIVEFAVTNRLPTLGAISPQYRAAGLLFFFSHSTAEHIQRLVSYVDKVLKGAKPGDLPVEQPTKFELVINLKTAKALGLTIPPSLLLRADQVIE